MAGVRCPFCEQDWLNRVRLLHLNLEVVMCPECESVWRIGEPLLAETGWNYELFMMDRGRNNPQQQGEVQVLERLVAS